MAKNKAKFKKNDVVLHKDQKVMLIVDDKDHMPNKGWLYTLRVVDADKTEYKRYYEDKLQEKCSKLKNAKAVKVLYGKK